MTTTSETASPAAHRTALEKACELAAAGFAVFPLNADKTPAIAGGHKAATREPTAQMFAGAALVGLPTGDVNGFVVIDIDPRHGGHAWLEQNADRLPVTHWQTTRSNGLHIRFKHVPGLRNSAGRLAPGVDIRAEGGYICAWGCEGLETQNADVLVDMPTWIVADLLAANETAAAQNAADLAPPSVDAVVQLFKLMPNPPELGRDPWVAIMLAAVGCVQGAEATGLQDADEAIKEAALAWSAKWIGADPEADEARWTNDFSTRGRALAGWNNLLRHATALGVDVRPITTPHVQAAFAAATTPAEAARPEPVNGWKGMLARTEKGNVMSDLQNAMTAFRHAPAWRGVLRFDAFAQRPMLTARPPWEHGDFQPRGLKDVDYTNAAVWLQQQGIHVRGSGTAAEAMLAVAHENPCHPVRDYLQGLKWDGAPRIDRWLVDHLGAEHTPLHRAFGAKFLISAVARVMRPGCQVDTVLVLEGAQGVGKSSAVRTLAGPWGATAGADLGSKDAMQQLQGRWIIEHAEMSHLRRADVARIKAWFSETVDVFRPSYGRLAAEYPRQCVFIATVNPESTGYLRDETGARRFWPVLCGATWQPGRTIDAGALAAARDQLWAEARHRFAAGEAWWLDSADLQSAQAEATAERSEQDAWHDAVLRAASAALPAPVTIAGILGYPALGLPVASHDAAAARRVGAILRGAGFTRRNTRQHGWTWEAPAHLQPAAPAAEGGNVVPLLTALLDRRGATAGVAG